MHARGGCSIEISHSLREHGLDIGIGIAIGRKTRQEGGYRGGDIGAAAHSLPPAERAIGILSLCQKLIYGRELIAEIVLIIICGKQSLLSAFVLSIQHPWRLREDDRLQLVVALKIREQRGVVGSPTVNSQLYLRVRLKDVCRDGGGIIS